MSRLLNFSNRNFKEVLRDPIIYIFCVGFPVVMMAIFQVISNFTGGNTPMFELLSLIPAIIMFSFTFVMLLMALLVSKDRQTFFLKRLYSSPMKSRDFVLGYASVGFIVGICQCIVCILTGLVISLITKVPFMSFAGCLLLILSQLPMLIICVFLGIWIGTILSDKSAPGVSSAFISLATMLGGCWMPLDTMGGFETFCRFLPFYPSIYLGRIATGATKTLGDAYTFDLTAQLGLIPIFLVMFLSLILSFVSFKKNMVSDKN
ncbi:MAG: ABC transporter permease [Clostridiales bacterium]|nr:ABC transporter permease [Clostridiales bacterium]